MFLEKNELIYTRNDMFYVESSLSQEGTFVFHERNIEFP